MTQRRVLEGLIISDYKLRMNRWWIIDKLLGDIEGTWLDDGLQNNESIEGNKGARCRRRRSARGERVRANMLTILENVKAAG